jgi:hypothetical protein
VSQSRYFFHLKTADVTGVFPAVGRPDVFQTRRCYAASRSKIFFMLKHADADTLVQTCDIPANRKHDDVSTLVNFALIGNISDKSRDPLTRRGTTPYRVFLRCDLRG